ncbi:MAG: diguanylate cyclase [Microgenomates group bacterium]
MLPTPEMGQEVMAPKWLTESLQEQIDNAKLARTDFISGLPNKLAWAERLEEHRLSRHPLTIMMLDLDRFKKINDTHGHLKGDTCIRDTATIIMSSVRPDDFVANTGGDEFAIILDCSTDDPTKIIEIVKSRLTKQFQEYNTHNEVELHFSVGSAISVYDQNKPHDTYQTFHKADIAMYAEKNNK